MNNITLETIEKIYRDRGYVGEMDTVRANELVNLSALYDLNWDLLRITKGTPNHRLYVEIERKLTIRGEKLRNELHVSVREYEEVV